VPPTPKEDRIASTIPPGRIDGPVTIPLPPPPPKPSVITNPSWSRQPQGDFPERALSRGVESGRVVLNCLVAPSGSMSDCQIVSEEPSGMGFGQEAIRGTRRARLSPRTVDGAATGARVTFTTRFQAPE
jgi:protein TonB